MTLTAEDLRVERFDGERVVLHAGGIPVELDAEGTRWLMRKLGEALLAPEAEPMEPLPASRAIPLRDGEVLLVRRMHRASWARDLEPQC